MDRPCETMEVLGTDPAKHTWEIQGQKFGDRFCKVSVYLRDRPCKVPVEVLGTDPAKHSVFNGDRTFGSSDG